MDLFAYGTLMDAEIMLQVSGAYHRSQSAILFDYVRKTVLGEVYPAILKCRGGSVDGIIYSDLSQEALARLDTFEGPLYVRKKVVSTCRNGEKISTYAYVIAPDAVNQLSGDDWSFEDFLANGQERFLNDYKGFLRVG